MNAIKGRIEHPQDLLKSLAGSLANEVHLKGKKSVILGISGGADSALAAHIAVRATGDNIAAHLFHFIDKNDSVEAASRAAALGAAYASTVVTYESKDLQPILDQYNGMLDENEKMDNAAINRCRRILLEQEAHTHDGIIINTKTLTDWLLGWFTIGGDDGHYPLLKFLLKTEVYKLLEEAKAYETEKGKDNITPVLSECLLAIPANSVGINEYDAMEGLQVPVVDHNLCVILAARESSCDLLLHSHKDGPVSRTVKQAKFVREANPFDYNLFRKTFFDA